MLVFAMTFGLILGGIKSTISQVGQSINQQEENVMRIFKMNTKGKML